MLRQSFILIFIFTAIFGFGQKYYSQNIEIEDEVPISNIFDIQKDSLNRLWIATDIGVVLYNGSKIDFFNAENGLLDNTILKIYIADDGVIWFATLSGKIFFYKDLKFQSTPFLASLDTLSSKSYYKIEVKNDNLLLLGNNGSAFNINLKAETVYCYKLLSNDCNNDCNIAIKKDSNFYINQFVNKIVVDSSKCITVDTSIIKACIDVNSAKTYDFSYLVKMHDTMLLTLGSKFVLLKNNKIIEEKGIDDDPEIISVFNNGSEIWFGTFRKGVFIYSKTNHTIKSLNLFNNYTISKMLRIDKERIIIGTSYNGIKIIRKNNLLNIFDSIRFKSMVRFPNTLANSQTVIYSIDISNRKIKPLVNYKNGVCLKLVEWSKDTVIAYGNRLISIDGNNNTYVLSDNYITCVKKTIDRIYIGYPYQRVDKRDRNLNYIGTYKILEKDRVVAIQNSNDKLYFGTRDGLFVMNDTSMSVVKKVDDNRVTTLLKVNNNMFIGTRFNGLLVMRSGLISKRYSFGFKSIEIRDILSLGKKLYISTNYGLIVAINNNGVLDNYKIISKSEGLKSSIVNSTFIYGDSILLCTPNGLYITHKDYQPKLEIPNIYLEDVVFKGLIDKRDGKNILKPYDNTVIIKYGSSIYDLGENVEFYYRLLQDGINWHKVSTQRISIYNLDPGNYDFEIYSRVKNKNSSLLKLSFKVDKPFYLKWYSILIFILILGSGISFIIVYRKRKKKLVVRLLQNELDMIQKQLNPHFVSNALNSLQSLILDDDFVKTNIFISNFSNLLRFSLRYSKKMYIGLNEELKYIESFIKLHQITNRKDFEYQVHISKGIESINNEILIPPFFIQPIIENAIVHGFENHSTNNMLLIEVVEVDNFIEVRIVDNGIGFNNSIKNKGTGRGISSVSERIAIYKDLEDYEIRFSISNSGIQDFGTIAQLSFEKYLRNERKL